MAALTIDSDPGFEARERTVQRWGTRGLVAVVLAGLLGLLGPGPLSQPVASSGPLNARYPAVGHADAEAELIIRVAADGAPHRPLQVRIAGSWVGNAGSIEITPTPTSESAGADVLDLGFASTRPVLGIVLRYRSRAPGLYRASIAADAAVVRFSQLVLP